MQLHCWKQGRLVVYLKTKSGHPKLHNTTLAAANVPLFPQFRPHLSKEALEIFLSKVVLDVGHIYCSPVVGASMLEEREREGEKDYSPLHKASSKGFSWQWTTHVQSSPAITSATRQLLVK